MSLDKWDSGELEEEEEVQEVKPVEIDGAGGQEAIPVFDFEVKTAKGKTTVTIVVETKNNPVINERSLAVGCKLVAKQIMIFDREAGE